MTQVNLFSNQSIEQQFDFHHFREALSKEQIQQILNYLRLIVSETPFFVPKMKNGTNFNVSITSIGKVGWISDEKGYRYQENHPNSKNWKEIPDWLYELLQHSLDKSSIKRNALEIDSCLINLYKGNGSLGIHYDKDEKDLTFPIISFSIGASAIFEIEFDKKYSYHVHNGDVIIMNGKSRNAKHGIKQILNPIFDHLNPLKDPTLRLNLTFRKAL